MSNSSSQGAYAPLPQSLSDSDSEKETPIKQKSKFHPSSTGDISLGNGYSHSLQTESLPEVAKITPPLTIKRKICFVLSILICFLTIIIFLWVLPCSESGTCPVQISNWENQHEGIELMGRINVVKSAFRNILNLAILFDRDFRNPHSHSGVISVLGNNGAVAWYIDQDIPPASLNCTLIDVNDDGISDCLIISEIGLEAVDPVSGNNFWYAHNHTNGRPIAGLDLPVILKDLNRDNVREILTTYNYKGVCKVLIISGRTGILIGEISIKFCNDLHIIESNATSLVYLRMDKNRPYYHHVFIADLISKIFDRIQVLNPPVYDKLPFIDLGYMVEGHRLIINNLGVCSSTHRLNCPVTVKLFNEHTHSSLFSWTYSNAFGFTPALFSFKRTRANFYALKGHINGFIIKLWQWPSDNRIVKRAVPFNNGTTSNLTLKVNTIIERILLVTFNSTNFHVVNASLTNITQLCLQKHANDYSRCQPRTENQMNSLLISDLDMDGFLEFISYSSTFVNRGDLDNNWKLVSTVRVIRLETELSKFFEVSKGLA